MTTDAINAPDEIPPEWRDAVLRHLDALGIRFMPLSAFVDEVVADMDHGDDVVDHDLCRNRGHAFGCPCRAGGDVVPA